MPFTGIHSVSGFSLDMTKDKRYTTVKNLISGGYIKTFREIFDTIPKSVVARDLGINNVRFSSLLNNIQKFIVKDLFRIAELLEVDEKAVLDLLYNQYISEKKTRKKKNS
jgi:hypothetical protein